MNFFDKFLKIDRRYIFILVAIGVVIPLVFPLGLAVTVSPPVKNVYDELENLKPGTPVLVSVDFDPSTEPELGPMTAAVLRHCFKRKLPVILMNLHPGGPGLALAISDKVAKEMGAKEGVDYCFLGYKAGGTAVILSIGRDIRLSYPADYYNKPIDQIPMMKNIRSYSDIGLVVTLSGSTFPDVWVAYAHERFGAKIAAGVTAVMAADYYPYLSTGQMIGLIGGLKGAAEYEKLIGVPGNGLKGMDAQTIIHLLIVLLIILGNIAFLLMRRQQRRGEPTRPSGA
jgi:hypothetical protein